MTREIRPIYFISPKAHDMAQREQLDPVRYADPVELPVSSPKNWTGKVATLLVFVVAIAFLSSLTR